MIIVLILVSIELISSNMLNRMKSHSPRFNSNITEAYCFVNQLGTVYDLLTLYDVENYIFETRNSTYILNFCKFTTSKCRKDNTFVIAHHKFDEQDCHLLSGTNPTFPSKWTIISKI
jgi:hypothetical protein